jgi:hypothetical protein
MTWSNVLFASRQGRLKPNSSQALTDSFQVPKGVIGLPTAIVLFCLLIAGAAYTLKGKVRIAIIAVILLLLVKSCLHYIRGRHDQ